MSATYGQPKYHLSPPRSPFPGRCRRQRPGNGRTKTGREDALSSSQRQQPPGKPVAWHKPSCGGGIKLGSKPNGPDSTFCACPLHPTCHVRHAPVNVSFRAAQSIIPANRRLGLPRCRRLPSIWPSSFPLFLPSSALHAALHALLVRGVKRIRGWRKSLRIRILRIGNQRKARSPGPITSVFVGCPGRFD